MIYTKTKLSPKTVSIIRLICGIVLVVLVCLKFFSGGVDTPDIDTLPEIDSNVTLSYEVTEENEFWGIVNHDEPFFTEDEITTVSYEKYAKLDLLGRCGAAEACLGEDLMPDEARGDISAVHPSGWHSNSPANYNRCHLIGFQLAGENDNERNLITGTRSLNVRGMLPFENEVAGYIRDTGNHVMYRVTPDFQGDNLVASGVLMEGLSVEDNGQGVCFCVYVYNREPGAAINYVTGEAFEVE